VRQSLKSPPISDERRFLRILDFCTMSMLRSGEGFRTPAACGRVVRVAGPAFESLPRRKPRVGKGAVWSGAGYGDFLGRGRSARGTSVAGGGDTWRRGYLAAGILGGGDTWRREYLAAGKKTTSFFAENPARVERERDAWRRNAELLKTASCCFGARPEGRRNGVARREAPRQSS
jgi:hypothetical protein